VRDVPRKAENCSTYIRVTTIHRRPFHLLDPPNRPVYCGCRVHSCSANSISSPFCYPVPPPTVMSDAPIRSR
jgi:hypothetical protein